MEQNIIKCASAGSDNIHICPSFTTSEHVREHCKVESRISIPSRQTEEQEEKEVHDHSPRLKEFWEYGASPQSLQTKRSQAGDVVVITIVVFASQNCFSYPVQVASSWKARQWPAEVGGALCQLLDLDGCPWPTHRFRWMPVASFSIQLAPVVNSAIQMDVIANSSIQIDARCQFLYLNEC